LSVSAGRFVPNALATPTYPDGEPVLTSMEDALYPAFLNILDINTLQPIFGLPVSLVHLDAQKSHPSPIPSGYLFSPNSQYLAFIQPGGGAKVIDINNQKEILSMPDAKFLYRWDPTSNKLIYSSPDNDYLLADISEQSSLLLSPEKGTTIDPIPTFSSDGKYLNLLCWQDVLNNQFAPSKLVIFSLSTGKTQ